MLSSIDGHSHGGDGGNLLSGANNPDVTIGVDGDYYINTTTSMLFGPKKGTWPAPFSLGGTAATAPISSLVTIKYIDEIPRGTIDGSNKAFTLSQTPLTGSVNVFVNGLRQDSGDYTLSDINLVLNAAPTKKLNITYAVQQVNALSNFTNDVAAAQGGVNIGQFYRNGSVVMVRTA